MSVVYNMNEVIITRVSYALVILVKYSEVIKI
jgi:hypothetical protein